MSKRNERVCWVAGGLLAVLLATVIQGCMLGSQCAALVEMKESEITSLKDAEISGLKDELAAEKAKVTEAAAAKSILAVELAAAQGVVTGLRTKLTELEAETLRVKLDLAARIGGHSEAVRALEARVTELTAAKSTLEAEVAELTKAKDDLEAAEMARKAAEAAAQLAEEARKNGEAAFARWAGGDDAMARVFVEFARTCEPARIGPKAWPSLVLLLNRPGGVAGEAQRALSHNLNPAKPGIGVAAFPFILEAVKGKRLNSANPDALGFAQMAVVDCGGAVVPQLLKAGDTDDDYVRGWVVRCLDMIVFNGEGEAVVRGVSDADGRWVQLVAAETLRRVEWRRENEAKAKAKAEAEAKAKAEAATKAAKAAKAAEAARKAAAATPAPTPAPAPVTRSVLVAPVRTTYCRPCW